jgi:hypothetical protein
MKSLCFSFFSRFVKILTVLFIRYYFCSCFYSCSRFPQGGRCGGTICNAKQCRVWGANERGDCAICLSSVLAFYSRSKPIEDWIDSIDSIAKGCCYRKISKGRSSASQNWPSQRKDWRAHDRPKNKKVVWVVHRRCVDYCVM